jgi:hypothetical protein
VDVLREPGRRDPADALRRRVRRAQLGVTVLQLAQLAQQLVVILVADLRVVEDVIAVVRLVDLRAQLAGALLVRFQRGFRFLGAAIWIG